MTLQEKYKRACDRRDRIFATVKGGMTETKQNELDAATTEVIKFRDKLLEQGLWSGPHPISVKAKYRR